MVFKEKIIKNAKIVFKNNEKKTSNLLNEFNFSDETFSRNLIVSKRYLSKENAIAEKAEEFVNDGDVIFLDGSQFRLH